MKKTVCEDVASKEVTRSYLLKISERLKWNGENSLCGDQNILHLPIKQAWGKGLKAQLTFHTQDNVN